MTDSDSISPPVRNNLQISRHCMQKLLHAALYAEQQPCLGLLGGSGEVFSDLFTIPPAVWNNTSEESPELESGLAGFCSNGYPMTACFVTRQNEGGSTTAQLDRLSDWLHERGLPIPALLAELDLNHKGRLEIHCYDAANDMCEIPLSMQEDGTLYPSPANH